MIEIRYDGHCIGHVETGVKFDLRFQPQYMYLLVTPDKTNADDLVESVEVKINLGAVMTIGIKTEWTMFGEVRREDLCKLKSCGSFFPSRM